MLDFKLQGKSCMWVASHFFLISPREVGPGAAGFCLHTDQKILLTKGDGNGAGIPLTYSCEPVLHSAPGYFPQIKHNYSGGSINYIGWCSKVTGTPLPSR